MRATSTTKALVLLAALLVATASVAAPPTYHWGYSMSSLGFNESDNHYIQNAVLLGDHCTVTTTVSVALEGNPDNIPTDGFSEYAKAWCGPSVGIQYASACVDETEMRLLTTSEIDTDENVPVATNVASYRVRWESSDYPPYYPTGAVMAYWGFNMSFVNPYGEQ